MARRKLIAGNWKMNGRRQDGDALIAELLRLSGSEPLAFDLLVCPPFTLLDRVGQSVNGSNIRLGGQDCHQDPSGAFTGEISAAQLVDLGATYVILGHSERRSFFGEKDALVRAKATMALAAGLHAIICVGESEAQRQSGQALAVVANQLLSSLPEGANAGRVTIAYEPVWAIGSGRTPTAAEIQQVHAHLRAELAKRLPDSHMMRILYGGSVKPANAGELLNLPDVDGGLIGGASLQADGFWAISLASVGRSA